MHKLKVNGVIHHVEGGEANLLDFLRDELRLTSMKNGCGEGACGACMVLVDGKAMRACLFTIAKADGKRIVTVEGFSHREKEAYAWAFAEAGAVQCGFCIPGMVISAKALLDKNQQPSKREIKEAIRGNICRCTGYVKIEKAIDLAAAVLRGDLNIPMTDNRLGVGISVHRVDAREKTLGIGEYVDDMQVEGMLYGAVLRPKAARLLIKKIDIAPAKALPGVEAVLTAKDIPGQRHWGFIAKDWPALVAEGEETRYIGDALAIVAASTRRIAREAVKAIRVEFEELEPIVTTAVALSEGAPSIHPKGNLLSKTHVRRGNPEAALARSAHVVTHRYTTPATEHAFLEPESALAIPGADGNLTVYVGTQSVYKDQQGIMAILGLPAEKVRVIAKLIGGGFGGKEDLSVQHHAALLAYATKKPVKLTLTRQESINVHPKRHAMEWEITTGCDAEGKLTAIVARIVADTGAYASLGPAVIERACTHVAGPYHVPNVDITGLCVYTNNPPAGAFRGFGVPQAAFACEGNMDLLAEKAGFSPWEFRFRNALAPGMTNATGQIADEGTAIRETLLAVRDAYASHPNAGIACAMKNTGIGVGLTDIGRVKLRVKDGVVRILTSAACIGQGMATIVSQIVAEVTGLPLERLTVAPPETGVTPDAGTTTASRQTLFTGEAARQAALALLEALNKTEKDGVPVSAQALEALEGREFSGEYHGITDPLNSPKANPVNHVAYSYATHVVLLDEQGRVSKVVAAHDVGRAINPKAIEGQIEGAVAMGLGFALREKFPLEGGIPQVKFGTLGLFRSTEMPEIETIIVEKNPSPLAFGAKGIGEIATIPVAPAVASAYYRSDRQRRFDLPLKGTPYDKG
ncbi:aldehyde oxidase/xanthine dehydrogenase, putative [Heliomicrobium modesticaldum Ice1]|uniref:Aldehyde oxidase/xanthine dehydrogenase, putative n=1 Tax=Heliobacterium modesticaldum (strain ATCC 51547 / Ice1) TaxID=498761 RepID=B0TBF7_HELMI|nr:selenium-dependent xanthine dehydrogenase [Heliomicrobium modesticaldum]ABZ85170.1 aldehyde oxidase/xanthine dehydrogenase, putative [Heliomicrobium modesticaldum Ice1]